MRSPEVSPDLPQDIGVRVRHDGETCFGCIGARREREGVWEAWVHQIIESDGRPSERSGWYPYEELEPLVSRESHRPGEEEGTVTRGQ